MTGPRTKVVVTHYTAPRAVIREGGKRQPEESSTKSYCNLFAAAELGLEGVLYLLEYLLLEGAVESACESIKSVMKARKTNPRSKRAPREPLKA